MSSIIILGYYILINKTLGKNNVIIKEKLNKNQYNKNALEINLFGGNIPNSAQGLLILGFWGLSRY